MRISDWSSDVCSSDLIAILSGLLGSDAKAYEYVAAQHPSGKSASGAPILPNHLADARKNNLKAERASAVLKWPAAARVSGLSQARCEPSQCSRTLAQIGRASCRERVCQYVYISGVAVS